MSTTIVTRKLISRAPGVALAALVGIGCVALVQFVPVVSALLIAISLGILLGSLRVTPVWAEPGISWSSKRLLRVGIVLLGLQLSLHSLVELGLGGIAVLLVTVAATFLGTLAIGQVMRVERVTRYLIATGFAICGASAVAAMASVIDPEGEKDEEVAQAIALVTLYGTVALFLIPALSPTFGLTELEAGLWVGASIHEVAQVVAAGSAISAAGLAVATVAKLGRVVLLAPLVATVGLHQSLMRRRTPESGSDPIPGARPPVVPLFVLGFLVCVAIRSFIPVPDGVLAVTGTLTTTLLAISMFGLGTGVDLRKVLRTGGKPAILGGASTVLAAAVSLIAIFVVRSF